MNEWMKNSGRISLRRSIGDTWLNIQMLIIGRKSNKCWDNLTVLSTKRKRTWAWFEIFQASRSSILWRGSFLAFNTIFLLLQKLLRRRRATSWLSSTNVELNKQMKMVMTLEITSDEESGSEEGEKVLFKRPFTWEGYRLTNLKKVSQNSSAKP